MSPSRLQPSYCRLLTCTHGHAVVTNVKPGKKSELMLMRRATSSSSLFGMHHQCVAPLAANSPHSGLSRAISIASSKVRLYRDRLFFRVAIQEEWDRPTGLLQSLSGTAVRILLASADSSILIRCRATASVLFSLDTLDYHMVKTRSLYLTWH